MQVNQIMTRDVRIANPEQSISEAARIMAECDVGDLLVLESVHDLFAHHFAHRRRIRRATPGDRAHGDVAIGDHTDEAVVLADRQGAGIEIGHHLCGCVQAIVGPHQLDLRGHQLLDFHNASFAAGEAAAVLSDG